MSNTKKVAVAINDIHKEFILPQHKNTSFKQTVVNIVKQNNKVKQKVLDGVSFEVNKGDFFGIVGRNGSGKSTLLKLIAGVYSPTAGSINLDGGLTPFIELGVGFNPELSGRDNVFLNGALLGFDRKQMATMYDDIVDFAELGPFMDQKLKNYSSGMQVRLAFSIAIKAKNDILIFDEVLAVGDEAFQSKCLDVFERYKAEGQTVILVTHDMDTVRQFCNNAVLLHQGKVIESGDPSKVANKYTKLNKQEIDSSVEKSNKEDDSKITVDTYDKSNKAQVSFDVDSTMNVRVDWSGLEGVTSVGVNIFKQSGAHVTGVNTLNDGIDVLNRTNIAVDIDLPVQPGKYRILVEAFKEVGERLDSNGTHHFTVNDAKVEWSGLLNLPHSWKVK
jgi:ABC-2 type transport system ATP-binding protein